MTEASLTAAQQGLARAYAGGVLVSGLVWLIATALILRRWRART